LRVAVLEGPEDGLKVTFRDTFPLRVTRSFNEVVPAFLTVLEAF
jgi:hypothetical protein